MPNNLLVESVKLQKNGGLTKLVTALPIAAILQIAQAVVPLGVFCELLAGESMRKRLPFLLSTIGILFLAVSFVYDIAHIDVASRDAAPGAHDHLIDTIALVAWLRTIGLFALIIGGFMFLTRMVVQRSNGNT